MTQQEKEGFLEEITNIMQGCRHANTMYSLHELYLTVNATEVAEDEPDTFIRLLDNIMRHTERTLSKADKETKAKPETITINIGSLIESLTINDELDSEALEEIFTEMFLRVVNSKAGETTTKE